MLRELPAFILGNGPTLPVAELPLLAGQFTVGVNRILRSGFVPTAIMWLDQGVADEEGPQLESSGALLLGPRQHTVRGMAPLDYVGGYRAWDEPSNPWTIRPNGNMGVAAARWAQSLGCFPVYLLGMSAKGQLDFYGTNPHHSGDTPDVMRRELDRLLSGGNAVPVADGAELQRIVSGLSMQYDQDAMRRELRGMIERRGQ